MDIEKSPNGFAKKLFVYFVSIVAAVGGFLFGFDQAVISGTIPFIERYFSLTAGQLGMAVSSASFGCIFGAVVAGTLSDRIGRKKVLILAAVLYLVSAIWTSVAVSLFGFIVARFIGGYALGLSSPISPVYIAEIAPARIRGRLVTLNQLAITMGMLLAYTTDWSIARIGTDAWHVDYAWRWMFGVEVLPASVFLVILFFVPESPRWLCKQGFFDKAHTILTKVENAVYADQEIADIKDVISHEGSTIMQLLRPPFRKPLMIGVLLMIVSQIVGMNVICNYTPKILMELGFESEAAALFGMMLIGVVLFIVTIVTICIIDKLGRRPLLIFSTVSLAVCLLILAVQMSSNVIAPGIVFLIVLFGIVSYAIGIGPCAWLIISEIFPTKVRGRAAAICTVSLWVSNFGVLFLFPVLSKWSKPGTFLLFFTACVFSALFVWFMIPETKGKTLEQIERSW